MSRITDLIAQAREYAYEAMGGKPKVIMGESMFANPMQRLFGQQKFDTFNQNVLISTHGYKVIDKMLIDDQVKAALLLKKLAITAPGYEILNPEGMEGDYPPAEFIREVFDEIEGTFVEVVKNMLTCLDYGFSVTEKVWTVDKPMERLGGKKMISLSALKTRSPRDVIFTLDDFGNLHGVKQSGRQIDIDKLIIYTHEGRFGNPYGTPDLHACYRPWWIKDNAYKWMAMLLERMGIPPIFFLYSNAYTPADVQALKRVVESLQAGTGGAIPRPTKPEDLEPWAPELADNVSQVFLPTIEHLNKAISRGVLVPALLGLSDQGSVGALARSETEFQVFMMVVDGIRGYLGSAIIQEQIIEPLVQLNFPAGTEQPRFAWKPLKDEIKVEIYNAWTTMTEKGVVTAQEEDEAAIRAKFKMPPLSDEGKKLREQAAKMKEEKGKAELKNMQNPPAGGPGKPAGKFSLSVEDKGSYTLYGFDGLHFDVDYSGIESALDALEQEGVARVRAALTDSRDDLVDSLRRKGMVDAKFVNEVTLRRWNRVQESLGEVLRAGSDAGFGAASDETTTIEEHAASRAGMSPKELVAYLSQKTIYVSGVLKDSILKEVKQALLDGVKTGDTIGEIIDVVTDVFVPWLGNNAAIDDPDVVQPHRTETVVRTNLTDAYNAGRLNRFRDPKLAPFIIGVQYSAILDERTTPVCSFLHGKVFKPNDPALDQLSPPRHYNCRSLLVPVMVDTNLKKGDFISPSEIGEAKELSQFANEDYNNPHHRPAGGPDGGQFAPKDGSGEPKKHPENTHTKIRRMIKAGKDLHAAQVSVLMREVIKYPNGMLSAEQLKALQAYVSSSAGLNGALRQRLGDLTKFPADGQGIKSILHLDKAFHDVKNFALPITVYRGMPQSVYNNLKVGDTFVDHGYISTTFSRKLALGWGSGTVEIKLPKGFKFVSIPSTTLLGLKNSLAHQEAEVLLPRSTVFRIKALRKGQPPIVEAIASSVQGQPKTWKKAAPASTTDPVTALDVNLFATEDDREERFRWDDNTIVIVEGGEAAFKDDDFKEDDDASDE